MAQLDLTLTIMAGLLLAAAGLSRFLEHTPIQTPMLALLAGLAVGPAAFGWLDVTRWGEESLLLEETARLTLAIGLMGVALRVKPENVRNLLKPVGWLLTVGMAGMWLAGSLVVWWLLSVPPWLALLIGAVISPTDPVVASSIVTGEFAKRHLPHPLRDGISLESGANDGLAYPLVLLGMTMLGFEAERGWGGWLVDVVVVGLGLAALVGAGIGYAAARMIRWSQRHDDLEDTAFLTFTVVLSFFTLGTAALLGTDSLLAVFAAGLTFNLLTKRKAEEEDREAQEAAARLFTLPMFVLFGAVLPWSEWQAIGWPLALLALLVLLLRRPPVVLALEPLLRAQFAWRSIAYAAWFGPVGVAAIYYAAFVTERIEQPLVWPVASAVVAASILIHGTTAAPLTKTYRRHG